MNDERVDAELKSASGDCQRYVMSLTAAVECCNAAVSMFTTLLKTGGIGERWIRAGLKQITQRLCLGDRAGRFFDVLVLSPPLPESLRSALCFVCA